MKLFTHISGDGRSITFFSKDLDSAQKFLIKSGRTEGFIASGKEVEEGFLVQFKDDNGYKYAHIDAFN